MTPATEELRQRPSPPAVPAPGFPRLADIRHWPLATKLHWVLRFSVFMEFVGHGAFGIMQKPGWIPYFNVLHISDSTALILMPVIGAMDIAIAVVALFRPMRAVLVYAALWSFAVSFLRPLAGQGVWEEVVERGGNYLPFVLLILVGLPNRSLRSWFEFAKPRPLDHATVVRLSWVLRGLLAALLIGHGAFALSHLHDQEWTKYFGVLGIGPDTIIADRLLAVVGWLEVALGVAVLVKPFRGLVAFVLVWKLFTELLRPLAGENFFEFVERGGAYMAPIALIMVQGSLISHRSEAETAVAPGGAAVTPAVTGGNGLKRNGFAGNGYAGEPASRRSVPPWRVGVGVLGAVAVTTGLVAFRGDATVIETRDVALRAEPNAGNWRTWVVGSPADIKAAAPPAPGSSQANADSAQLKRLSIQRDPKVRAAVTKWSGAIPSQPWTDVAFDFVSKSAKNPPLSSRNYALLNVAMYDAVVTTWHWKYHYNVAPPDDVSHLVSVGSDPSYPSEHAAITGAASRLLEYMYPNQPALRLEEMAEEAGFSRVQAGVNTAADVAAGLDLGRRVAERVIAYAKADGSDKVWDGSRPPGIGHGPQFWEPPPGSVSPPVAPLGGTWKSWVLGDNSRFRPPPPPAYGSPEFIAAAKDVVDVQKHLTPEEQRVAKFYEGAEGTSLPAGVVVDVASRDVLKASATDVASRRFTIPEAVRALTLSPWLWPTPAPHHGTPSTPTGTPAPRTPSATSAWIPTGSRCCPRPASRPTSRAAPPTPARPRPCSPTCSPTAPPPSPTGPRTRPCRVSTPASTGATTRPASTWVARWATWWSTGPATTAADRCRQPDLSSPGIYEPDESAGRPATVLTDG